MKINTVSSSKVPRRLGPNKADPLTVAFLTLKVGKVLHVRGIKYHNARARATYFNKAGFSKLKLHVRVVSDHPNQAWYWMDGTKIDHCFE